MPRTRFGNSKLTQADVLNIRAAYHDGRTQRELCQLYNVSITTIGHIVRGETWRWLGEQGEGSNPYDGRPRDLPPDTPELAQAARESAERLQRLLAEDAPKSPEGDKPA